MIMMDFKQKFEPKGNRVIHGAGQEGDLFKYADDFKDYWNTMGNKRPVLFMTYIQLKYVNAAWFELIKKQIKDFPNVLLQIGLSMSDTHSGEPEKHYEQEVPKGKYNQNIIEFCKGIRDLRVPCFVRPGYEFNGLSWYGYQPKTFVRAWKYLIEKVRESNVENIAWVWHYSPEGESNYMDYYPGDDCVDWWATTIFSSKHLKDNEQFIKDAEKHRKPVMIAESSARGIGTIQGKESWNKWFKPYFEWISNNPIVKSFCYINWDWSTKQEIWKEWGDCIISHNELVKEKYLQELSKGIYINNMSMEEFLKLVHH